MRELSRESLIWTPWLWRQSWRPNQPHRSGRPEDEAWPDGPTGSWCSSNSKKWTLMSPPSHNALPCWASNWRAQNVNSLTPPEKMPRRRRVMPQVCWTPSSMPARVRRQMPQGARIGCPQPKGTAKGIVPCKGNIPGHQRNFGGPRIGLLVSHCFKRPQKRMPSHIRIGAVRSRMP